MNFELLINVSLEALKSKSSLCNHVIEGYRNSLQKQPSRCPFIKICPENMQQFYRRTPKPKCDLNKVTKQVYWNHTSALVLSYKFAANFQKRFYKNTSEGLLLSPFLVLCKIDTAYTSIYVFYFYPSYYLNVSLSL